MVVYCILSFLIGVYVGSLMIISMEEDKGGRIEC